MALLVHAGLRRDARPVLSIPQAAGVGFSFNPYVWHESIDPKAGVLRLVFGLGTRAVDRSDDDYTRLVALNAPQRRPESNFEEVRQYAQRRVDYLDLQANRLMSGHFLDVMADSADVPVEMFASADESDEDVAVASVGADLRRSAYGDRFRPGYAGDPPDAAGGVRVPGGRGIHPELRGRSILQDPRGPMPAAAGPGHGSSRPSAATVAEADTLVEANGAVIGHSRHIRIDPVHLRGPVRVQSANASGSV